VTREDLGLAADHQLPLEPVTAQPVQLALESFPVLAYATADQAFLQLCAYAARATALSRE
jgi:hypothetical protein